MENKNDKAITYGVGRFVVDIPDSMEYRGGSYHLRLCELSETILPEEASDSAIQILWQKNVDKINQIEPPKGKNNVIIDTIDFESIGKWCKGLFYFKEPKDPNRGYIDLFLNSGFAGLWVKFSANVQEKEKIVNFVTKIAKAYRPPTESTGQAEVIKGLDSFYLRYGAVDLPYKYEEGADLFFKGHKLDENIELSIKTRVIHKEKTAGLLERAEASIATGYAEGLKIKKIKSGKRTVAGLDGEELIEVATEDGEKILSFMWMYTGKVDSGEFPNVTIDMNAEYTNMDQKIALWDSILDSMRPASK